MENIEIQIPFWLQVVLLIATGVLVPLLTNWIANRGGYRLRMAQALLGEASAAEIIQKATAKQLKANDQAHAKLLKEYDKRIAVLEKSDATKNRKIAALEGELVTERSKRRELERGVGILSRQLSVAGINPEWQPPKREAHEPRK